MPDKLDAIFKSCLDAVDVEAILSLVEEKKKTGLVILAGIAEFCGTFGVAKSHPVFTSVIDLEDAEGLLTNIDGQKVHLIFLSYEVMGLRGFRLSNGRTASSFLSQLIQSNVEILSFEAPVSNCFAKIARSQLPKAYAGYEDYFEKKISFIVLTGLNNAEKFSETIRSFCKNVPASDKIEVVVVINGSTDDSVVTAIDQLALIYDLKLVYPKGNIGYGGGMNAGIDVAKGQYICLIPDDIKFLRYDPFNVIVALLDKEPSIGIVGAYCGGYCFSLADPENADGLEYPFWIMPVGNVSGPQECEWLDGQFVEVDYASALCFVFRRELGRYDPLYYPYGLEEVAFCLEAKKRGYKVFLTNAGLSHDFHASVTRKKWVKNSSINSVHLPYANASYQLLERYASQLRDPEKYLGVKLYSMTGQLKTPPNKLLSLEDMKGKVDVCPIPVRA